MSIVNGFDCRRKAPISTSLPPSPPPAPPSPFAAPFRLLRIRSTDATTRIAVNTTAPTAIPMATPRTDVGDPTEGETGEPGDAPPPLVAAPPPSWLFDPGVPPPPPPPPVPPAGAGDVDPEVAPPLLPPLPPLPPLPVFAGAGASTGAGAGALPLPLFPGDGVEVVGPTSPPLSPPPQVPSSSHCFPHMSIATMTSPTGHPIAGTLNLAAFLAQKCPDASVGQSRTICI